MQYNFFFDRIFRRFFSLTMRFKQKKYNDVLNSIVIQSWPSDTVSVRQIIKSYCNNHLFVQCEWNIVNKANQMKSNQNKTNENKNTDASHLISCGNSSHIFPQNYQLNCPFCAWLYDLRFSHYVIVANIYMLPHMYRLCRLTNVQMNVCTMFDIMSRINMENFFDRIKSDNVLYCNLIEPYQIMCILYIYSKEAEITSKQTRVFHTQKYGINYFNWFEYHSRMLFQASDEAWHKFFIHIYVNNRKFNRKRTFPFEIHSKNTIWLFWFYDHLVLNLCYKLPKQMVQMLHWYWRYSNILINKVYSNMCRCIISRKIYNKYISFPKSPTKYFNVFFRNFLVTKLSPSPKLFYKNSNAPK